MAEYIDREAALEAAKKSHLYFDLKPIINSIHATEVRPVARGKWKRVDNYRYPWRCTNCRKTFSGRYNFCPNCGAMMEES